MSVPQIDEEHIDDPSDPALKYFTVTATAADKTLDMRFINTEVCHVYPGGWAEKNGVEIDDEIWDVDGHNFALIGKGADDQTEQQIKTLSTKRPLTIKFKRPKYKDSYYELLFDDKKIGVKYLENVITTVHEGEWAWKNGVKPGDTLLTMNGRIFMKMTNADVFHAIRHGPKPVKMYFKRPAEVHLNQAALASGKTVELDLKVNPNDPTESFYELKIEQKGSLGMRWAGNEIVHIVKDSWASIHTVEIDDEIYEVNGESFFEMSDQQKEKALTQTRTPYTIKFRRPKFKDSYINLTCSELKLGLKYYNGTITTLHPGGWGERNGIAIGDQLLELQNKSFVDMHEDDVVRTLQGPRPLNLLIKRPAEVNKDLHAMKMQGGDGDARATEMLAGDGRGTHMGGDLGPNVLIKDGEAGEGVLCCWCMGK